MIPVLVIVSILQLLSQCVLSVDGLILNGLLEALIEVPSHLLPGIKPIRAVGVYALHLPGCRERKNRNILIEFRLPLALFFS